MLGARFCRTVSTRIPVVEYAREPRAPPLPACGERSRAQRAGEGDFPETELLEGTLTPTLSPQAGSGSAPSAKREQTESAVRRVTSRKRLRPSFPRKRESRLSSRTWVPAGVHPRESGGADERKRFRERFLPCRPCSRFTKTCWRTAPRSRCRRPRA